MAMESMKSPGMLEQPRSGGIACGNQSMPVSPQVVNCESEAARIIDKLGVLSAASRELRDKVGGKMRPLIREVPEKERGQGRDAFVGADSPLFREIAGSMNTIYDNLCVIDEILAKVEV